MKNLLIGLLMILTASALVAGVVMVIGGSIDGGLSEALIGVVVTAIAAAALVAEIRLVRRLPRTG